MELVTRTLGEICEDGNGVIRTGPFGTQLHSSDYQDKGTPVVMPKNIVDDRISTEDIARVAQEDVDRLSQHKLQVGDIVYGRRGDIGRRALITEREAGWLCGTGCLRISLGDSNVDPTFLYYYLGDPQLIEWIYNQAVGATMPNLNTSILESVPVTYPCLSVQRKIAGILSAYDDLIENNTRRIEILEEVAQAIYREWFVHYRFPGHEDVELVESELGPVPAGWEVVPLGNVIKLRNGKRIEPHEDGQYPVYGSNGVIGYFNEPRYQDAVIIGRVGANCGSVEYCKSGFHASDNTIIARTKDDRLSTELTYYHLKHLGLRRYAGGSAQPLLTQRVLKRLPLIIPDENTKALFTGISVSVHKFIVNLRRRSENLRETRDLLLPRLISREIDLEVLENK